MTTRTARQKAAIAASVDEYLAGIDPPERGALARLRAAIRKAAPDAVESISYRIPTYRLNGPLVHFMATPKHLSFVVVSADAMRAFHNELKDFEVSGRTIHFSAKKPIPVPLVRRIVELRVRESR